MPHFHDTTPEAWRNPGFVAFLFARLAGMFATQIQAMVVVWQVYEFTRSPMALAWVGLAQFLPMLLLLMPAGELIDRASRKLILMASWGVAMLCSLTLAWLTSHGSTGVNGIYVTLVLFGCSRAFSGPALQSLLPQIVPRVQLAHALATNGMVMRAASIGGPIIGGMLYARGGGEWTYAVCALSFFAAAFLLHWVKTHHAETRAAKDTDERNVWRRFGAGIGFIFRRPIIFGSISLDLFAVLLGGVVALLPIYAVEILHTDAEGLGWLRAAIAIGEVGAGVVLSLHPFNRAVGRSLFVAVAIFGLANLVFSLSHWFWLSLTALMVAGAADMVSVYIRGALVQFATPDDMRGRVNAVTMLFIGSSNELGEFR
ncbi:MAG: MFS transporter, partial [Azoarcus sp.]|nr:MFS transporter [Azoarcus sp.]